MTIDEPDRFEAPEINIDDHTIGALMAGLMTGEIAVPCWIRLGRTWHKITGENKAGIERGLLIALEIQTKDL